MLELKRELIEELDARHVRIEVPDGDTVIFRNVPANPRFFSKDCTNLLVKRPGMGMPFLVGVDEDLKYTGADPQLTRTFAGDARRSGWRTLRLAQGPERDFQTVVRGVLAALGFDGQSPVLLLTDPTGEADTSFLNLFGTNLTGVKPEDIPPTVAREDEIDETISCMLRWDQPRLALIVGQSGVGKTNLLHGIAHKLRDLRPTMTVTLLDLVGPLAGAWFEPERESLLARLFREIADCQETIVALEHVELALCSQYGKLLLTQLLDQDRGVIGTTTPACLNTFLRDPLARRLHVVEMRELTPARSGEVLAALRDRISSHHGIEIAPSCIPACVRAAGKLEGFLPAKALRLLDEAATRAALAGAKVLAVDDIYFAAKTQAAVIQPEEE